MAANTTLSNLYVEKASSEHPLALWMLNENVDYVSQITENQRKFELFASWIIQNGEAVAVPTSSVNAPFSNSATSRIIGQIPPTSTMDVIATSQFLLSSNLVEELRNFAIGFYVYFDTALCNSVSFGYQYQDVETNETVEVLEAFEVRKTDSGKWRFFSYTFDLPPAPELAQNVKVLIKFNVAQGGVAGAYDFLINGLSIGQRSENFNKTSFGVTPQPLPSNINLPSEFKALSAFPYGASGQNAYYLSQGFTLSCVNFGVPLVFGSSNITKISPNVYNNEYYPSIIFPGYGFLNERGRNNSYTIEMWVRINSFSGVPRKIFGPIAGNDGLYADGGYLTFKIADQVGSHFVGEWFRPMLIHIRALPNSLIVLLNGEEVISLSYEDEDFVLPPEFSNNKSQDWLGFYAYPDIDPIDIDNFSIYSYAMPTEVAKRRWVWGQAVSAPEETNSSINAVTAFNDYAFANYAANYNYPDLANWKQAFFSNMIADSKSLALPGYELPDFNLDNKTSKDLFKAIQDNAEPEDDLKYITLKPSEDWDSDSDYIYFENVGILNEPVQTIYGVFETDGTEENRPLIKITNKINGDYLLILINENEVSYIANVASLITTLKTKTVEPNTKFTVGLNIPGLSSFDFSDLNKFFSDLSSLDMFVGGDGFSKFSGKIYKIGFDASYNNRKISDQYDEDGVFYSTEDVANDMALHIANYTLTVIHKYGLLFPDIAVSGYWEDYLPLSYFSKQIKDFDGTKRYEIDSVQYNQDFPEPTAQQVLRETEIWTYGDLFVEYSQPNILTYATLNNAFYTKWNNYLDMSENAVTTQFYNTDTSVLRSFVSFQRVAAGANRSLIDFNNYVRARTSGILDPLAIPEDWSDTAYEVTTGTVIYPPTKLNNRNIRFDDYAMVYHLDFKSDGILHHPLRFKELQLASQVLERTDFTPVGSRFGVPVYYYTRSGIYYDLKAKNPISTYKRSTPYLYLNRQSGWRLRGDFDVSTDRGLLIPVNLPRAEKVEVSSIQMWVRFSEEKFPADPVMIFSIDYNFGTYDFFIQADSTGDRGFVFAVDRESSEVIYDLKYYINGQATDRSFLYNDEWAVLGIEFPDLLDFSNQTGRLNLNGPLTYNNISYNLATNIEKDESIQTRAWADMLKVKVGGVINITTDGTKATYTTTSQYIDGELVTIEGVIPSAYDVTNVRVSVAGGGPSNTFTIDTTETESYLSGGTITSGKWSDIKTELLVIDGTVPPYRWQQVKIISQSRTFTIDPKAIYEKYTGSNRIVIDDESSGVLVDPEKFKVYKEISWQGAIKTAV
jgi:hypothetical protein